MELTFCHQFKLLLSVRFLIKLSKGADCSHDYVRLPLSQWEVHIFVMTLEIDTVKLLFPQSYAYPQENTLFVFTFITEILDARMIK